MGLKIILTGASGYVGQGVLLSLLEDDEVSEVLMVNRRPLALSHPKAKELVVADFLVPGAAVESLAGYDGCFYCAGISSVGMKEAEYTRITYDTTLHFATALSTNNPSLVFCFVSGAGTKSPEQAGSMWSRVKGKTEQALSLLPFRGVYHFRPGGMLPAPGQKNAKGFYVVFARLIALFAPKWVLPLKTVAAAMRNAVVRGYHKPVLEIRDIRALAEG